MTPEPVAPTPHVVELLGPAVGGIRAHVEQLAAGLRAQGHTVTVAGPVAPDYTVVDEVVAVPNGLDPRRLRQARAQLAGVAGEVIHAHGLKAGWVALLSRPRRPVVLTLHNLVLGDHWRAKLERWLERRLIAAVDHVISPSSAIDAYAARFAPAERRSVILPVSRLAEPTRDRATVRAAAGVADGVPMVVCVARLHPQKRLDVLVDALSEVRHWIPEFRAFIIGDGPLRDAVRQWVNAASLNHHVELLGARTDAVDYIAAADVLAISSDWEAVPLVALEAASCAVPIVSTDVGVVADFLVPHEAAQVTPVGDAAALGAGIIAALRAEERRGNGPVAVAEHAAPEQLVRAVAALYRRLATAEVPS
jgi:glycosyltransferase involved in cell wall biosynthesis